MTRLFITIGIATPLGAAIIFVYLPNSNFWDNRNPVMKLHMWEVTQAWAGVPNLPEDAVDFQIHTLGNSSSRTFESSFTAPSSSIEAWLAEIPDFNKSQRSQLPGGDIAHIGAGRQGAAYYKLAVNAQRTKVHLSVSWNRPTHELELRRHEPSAERDARTYFNRPVFERPRDH